MSTASPAPAATGTRAEQTVQGHDHLLISVSGLERALGSVARPEQDWARGVAAATELVHQTLIVHTLMAEDATGLLRDLSGRMPQAHYQIDQLREAHVELLDESEALLFTLEKLKEGRPRGVGGVRRRATALITAVRLHLAREVDLLYEAYEGEFGSPD